MRSEAQKAADRKYRESHKGTDVAWQTRLKPEDAQRLEALIAAKGWNRAEFLRWATEQLENK